MPNCLYLDWESRSAADLREVGLYNYANDPTTDLWCGAFAFDDEPVDLWTPGQPCPPRVRDHIASGGKVIAHNFFFEIAMNNAVATRYGWPAMSPEQCECTLAMAYSMGLPGGLEDAAMAVGLHLHKDMEGRALMLRMARPRKVNPDGTLVWWDDQERLARLYAYCQQDVRVERELHKRLMPLSSKERAIWLLDYKINQRGVAIDRPSVEAAITVAEKLKADYDAQMKEATGGAAETCNALIPVKQWLEDRGIPANDGLAKQNIVDLLAREDLSPEVRRVLTLRQEASKASTAKFTPMLKIAGSDNRLRNLFQYHGAATGRWAGRKVQPHNLPREVPPTETVDRILEHVRNGEHEAIDMIYGSPMSVLSRCLRGFFVPAPGKVLVGGDYSAIEGRGTAWIAGEAWKLRAFRDADAGTGPGIYELTAGKILGIAPDKVNKEQRQAYGKVPELALGYQGGVGAFQTMAKTYGVKISDDEADSIKVRWRSEHPRIKQTWYDLQNAAINAVRSPGEVFATGHPSRPVKFKKVGSFLWCLLPSGRALCYPYPKLLPGTYGEQLTYMCVPSPDDKKKGKIIADPHNAANWARCGTYGGSLLENVVQAICRDILAEAMLRLDRCGFDIVLHVHDEIVCEAGSVKGMLEGPEEMTRIVAEVPTWATDFPIAVKCEAATRYGK